MLDKKALNYLNNANTSDPLDFKIGSSGSTPRTMGGDPDENYQALVRSNLGRVNSFIPSKVGKALREGQAEIAKAEISFRTSVLKSMRNAQQQALAECRNAWLEAGKTTIRSKLSEDFSRQYLEVVESLQRVEEQFTEYVNRADESINAIKNETLRDLRQEALVSNMEDFFHTVARLRERFKSVLNEGIDAISGDPRHGS